MLKKLLAILSVYLFIVASGEIHKAELDDYKLPNQTYPESYEVQIIFQNFDEFLNYTGFNSIKIKVLEETESITLHSSGLIITRVRPTDGLVNVALNYTLDIEHELLIIKRSDDQKFAGNTSFVIQIRFSGEINEIPTTQGVYRGIYSDDNKTEHYFIASHLQPKYARKVFPCYDEPGFESVFKLSITHPAKYHAISNTDKLSDEENPSVQLFTRTFEETSLISAHSLKFFISDLILSNENKIIQSGMRIRVYSQPSQMNRTNFGFSTAIKDFLSIEAYFSMSHPLKNFDLLIMPQFDYEGNKNSGFFFYEEDSFLFDENDDTALKKELVSRKVFNKICQTFIGSSSWLHEGLCKFYEYYLTDSTYPEMGLNKMFALEVMQPEMIRDSSSLSHTLTSDVEKLSVYSKAASVIRMFNYALSEKTFKHGLQIYINKITSNPEEIAEPKDFYESLQLAVTDLTVNVVDMFGSWESQAGYPILYAIRNFNGNNVLFSQKRFTDDIKNGTAHNELWGIPITYSTKTIKSAQLWFSRKDIQHNISGLNSNDYVIVNVDQTGYYRVMYDDANWMAIANELFEGNLNNISPNTRAMLIDDATTFVETKILDLKVFLELIKYLKHETDYEPWMCATKSLSFITKMLNDGNNKLYNDFQQKFLQTSLKKVFDNYGVEEQSSYNHHQKYIRNLAINLACKAHLQSCLSQAENLFNRAIINSEVTISSDLRHTIMCSGAILGNFTTFYFLWDLYKNAPQPSERLMLLKSIGCIENSEVLMAFISNYSAAIDDEWFTIIQSVYSNGPIGLKVAIEFLDTEFADFFKFINDRKASDSLVLIFKGIAERVVTDEVYAHFPTLMDKYRLTISMRESLNAIIKKNLEWIRINSPIIDEFLNSSRIVTVSLTAILFGFLVQYFLR